jgi:nicotinate-nucleotide--dimethylbenzimidazole phosphoribosyltransferase
VDSKWLTDPCPAPSIEHAASARARQSELTKPPGSLGVLERLAVQLAALQGRDRPSAVNVPILLFAADHGVTAQGVSAFPAAVTVQMLQNFANGGAAISVLARELGVPLHVVDVGTLAEAEISGVTSDKTRRGTRDFSREPAMTQEEVLFALGAGRRAVERVAVGADLLILGEMGIGNTASAAALAAALLHKRAGEIVGAGTGLDSKGVAHKARVVSGALTMHGLDAMNAPAMKVLTCVGGLEIAALAGAIIAAGQARIPVLIDGFIVSAAALVATRLNVSVRSWLIYSHRSAEQGHRMVLDALDADPILDLKLRLGEGSGAAAALPLIRLACALHAGMATFEEARVSSSGRT